LLWISIYITCFMRVVQFWNNFFNSWVSINMKIWHYFIKLSTSSIQEEVAPSNVFAFYGKFKLTSKIKKCSIKVPRKYPLFIVTISEHSPKFGIKWKLRCSTISPYKHNGYICSLKYKGKYYNLSINEGCLFVCHIEMS